MIERRDNLPRIIPPFFEFPKIPKIIKLNGHDVYEYVIPLHMNLIIKKFSNQINLNWFDEVLLNQKGGEFFARTLAKLQNYKKPLIEIEYHRNHQVTTTIPDDLRFKKICVIDDILDGGGTALDILNYAPNTSFVFLTKKNGIENQVCIPRSLVALQISNVWVGDCGMNLEIDGDGLPKDFARDYSGLIAKII